ncbi:hypothetical protein HFP89_11370 [Wenzhouxiangella sp. XN79A]|uniref:hypothetical protein n=1 Tax=Wenzhouxiangella sp. XN79A TaxID=2724193 RepID=UPI00144A519B|nr:hypothetical protein [Wenzhouxiangella sp. XN79A]NKI35761.1 hypothetical protein [Wenzhouxiangella sp. XN79A]
MRSRLDRFVEDALEDFSHWFLSASWQGKERDCVNLFAHRFLAAQIQPGAAVSDLAQVRIEGAVPQPRACSRQSAPKDLVIWNDALATAWDENWRAAHHPRLVMEWKLSRSGRSPKSFSQHDVSWLTAFTAEYPDTFGYLVRVHAASGVRTVDWAKVRCGAINETNRRS